MRLRAALLSPTSPTEWAWIPDAYVEVRAGKFVTIAAYAGQPVDEDLRPGVLLPGFIDAHLHFPQARIIGSASGPLLDWLAQSTFPEEARFADRAHAEAVATHFIDRMLAAGTTYALAYSSIHGVAADALFAEADRRGMRLLAGPVLMDEESPPELCLPLPQAIDQLDALRARWHGHEGRLHLAVIPRFALSCSREMLAGAGAYAQQHKLWVSTHLAENEIECRVATERFGTHDYLQIYEDAGMLHDKSVYAHCIHLTEPAWDRFAAAKAVVAHCPDSNDFLGSGAMPIGALAARGIPVAAGTDVGAGRTFRVPHVLSRAYDNGLRRQHPLDLAGLLWLGTRGGALALGQDHLGALQPGLAADMTLWAPPPWVETPTQVLAHVIFDADTRGPTRTWIAGREVWRDSALFEG